MLSALVLGACSPALSPEAQCFADATIDYRAAWRGVQQIDADLARGYGLRRSEAQGVEAVPCREGGRRAMCLANTRKAVLVPVPIDAETLRARRVHLKAKMEALRPQAMAAAAPCGFQPSPRVRVVTAR
ncbi:MAG: hypothetical protein D6801_01725 [Alphaproteobacteria bacterium]|nr:MAG: hypothetical protein D6801_01725 [Alphaproteobacteria bacterium]